MVRKYSFDCPVCGMPDSVLVTTWNDPGTRDDPPDAGMDVTTRCVCDLTDEQVEALSKKDPEPSCDPDFDPEEGHEHGPDQDGV